MANVSDKSILTAAGKALLAQLNAEEKALVIDKMIFANVPNRPEYPQPDDVVPTDNVVHQAAVEQRGRLSEDSVIYSTTLASNEGPFEFNWTGAYCSEYGVLVTIDHHSLTPKTVDEPGVSGNTLVRSVVLEYKDIAEITNITVDASTWQYNATPRMKKMDDDVAQANIDQNGKDWFIEEGFLVTPQASAFSIKAGPGYVSGNRVALDFDRSIQVPNKPSFIYIDAHREGTSTGEQVTLFNFVVSAEEKDDYIDSSTGKDVPHFVCKIAQVLGDGSVSDLRPEGEIKTFVGDIAGSLAGGGIWPLGVDSVRIGDIIPPGVKFLRINGGSFSASKICGLIKLDGQIIMPSGMYQAESLSDAPYSVKINGMWYRLTNIQHVDELSEVVNPKMVFADYATTDEKRSEALQIATNYAIATGRRYVVVDDDYYGAVVDESKAQVIYIGKGSLPDTYRKTVVSQNAPLFKSFEDLSDVNLWRFRCKPEPVVVFLGDSTYTIQPDVRSRTETIQSMLMNKISRLYPDKKITFHNRAIGGQRWDHADGMPSRDIWWYTDPERPWLDYIEELNPDLVVVGFGMNDGANTATFSKSAVGSVINKLKSMPTRPDVLVGTNLVPSIGTPQAGFNSIAAQEGRDFVAGYVRSYCLANKVSILDFNRYSTIVRDGFDVINTNIHRDGFQDARDINNGKWLYSREVYDFNVEVYASLGSNQAVLDVYDGIDGVFSARIGAAPDDVVFFDNDGGKVRLRFFSGGVNYLTVTTEQDIPTGAVINFFLEVSGNTFTYRDGPSDEDIDLFRTDSLIRCGGLFQPNVGYYNQSGGPLNPAWVTTNYGVPNKFMPSVFDADLWGSPSEVVETRPEGGNGVNHPSSEGAKRVYAPVIDGANWTRPFMSDEAPKSIESGVVDVRPIICSIKDKVVTLSGVVKTGDGATLFVVSDNAKPGFSELFTSAVGDSGGGNLTPVALRISPSGYVQVAAGQSVPSVVYLDGVTYSLNG